MVTELKQDIGAILDYLWNAEENNYEEYRGRGQNLERHHIEKKKNGEIKLTKTEHIFEVMKRVKETLK